MRKKFTVLFSALFVSSQVMAINPTFGEIGGMPVNTSIGANLSGSSFSNSLPNSPAGSSSDQHASQDSCERVQDAVSSSIGIKLRAYLPQDENDNVFAAVEESQAMNTANQSTSSFSIKDLFTNPFDFLKQAATKLYEAAKEKAQEFIKNAYSNAVSMVTSYVNKLYADKLTKIASKLGPIGGSIVQSSLNQFVPDLTLHLGNCATSMSAECMSKTMDIISKSADEAGKRVKENAKYEINRKTQEVINDAQNKIESKVNEKINEATGN